MGGFGKEEGVMCLGPHGIQVGFTEVLLCNGPRPFLVFYIYMFDLIIVYYYLGLVLIIS